LTTSRYSFGRRKRTLRCAAACSLFQVLCPIPELTRYFAFLFAQGKTFWHNVATGSTQREKPILKRGGILADEMGSSFLSSILRFKLTISLAGLGMTMQTISLICTDDTGEGVLDEPEEPDERFDDMTLIGSSFSYSAFFPLTDLFCPQSVLFPSLRTGRTNSSSTSARSVSIGTSITAKVVS
jgi:hypothetical protein